MATITTAGSGNWSDGATWTGGVVPTSADAVVIAAGHNVTMDQLSIECSTLSVYGTCAASTSTSSSIAVNSIITVQNTGSWIVDVSASDSIKHTMYLNREGSTSQPNCFDTIAQSPEVTFKGFPRKRWTRLTGPISIGAESAVVDDATGWAVGDIVVFGCTSSSGDTGATESVVLTSISGETINWSGGTTYDYQDDGYVGNMSSNCTIRGYADTQNGSGRMTVNISQEPSTKIKIFSNVAFQYLATSYVGGLQIYSPNQQSDSFQGVLDCAFYNTYGTALRIYGGHITLPIERNVFWAEVSNSVSSYNLHLYFSNSISQKESTINNNLFLRNSYRALYIDTVGSVFFNNNVFCGVHVSRTTIPLPGVINRYDVFSCMTSTLLIPSNMYECAINQEFGYTGQPIDGVIDIRYNGVIELKNCILPSVPLLTNYWKGSLSVIGAPDAARVFVTNKNKDVTLQEIYTNNSNTDPTWSRENTICHRSISSFKISLRRSDKSHTYTIDVPCQDGSTVRIIGYIQVDSLFYNSGDWVPPKVIMSGLGITPVVHNASVVANGAWEKFDISATNTSGSAGEFSLEYDVQTISSSGNVYISGIPDSPFVVKCRHYGFVFDESSLARKSNIFVSAVEATAAAYTGISIDHAARKMTISEAHTHQEIYDYTQYDAVENIDKDVWFTTADGQTFLSDYDIEIVGVTVSGSGITWNLGSNEFTGTGAFGGNVIDVNGALVAVTINNVIVGSSVRVFDLSDDTNLLLTTASGTSVGFNHNWLGDVNIGIDVRKATTAPFYRAYYTEAVITSNGASINVIQETE